MRVKEGNYYILVGSRGGAPKTAEWVYDPRADGNIEIRDETEMYAMRVHEVVDAEERGRLWKLAVAAFPPFEEYQIRTVGRQR